MPYQKAVLSLDDAQRAMQRMLQEANKAPNRPLAIAIVDDQGELDQLCSHGQMRATTADDCQEESLHRGAGAHRHRRLCRTAERPRAVRD